MLITYGRGQIMAALARMKKELTKNGVDQYVRYSKSVFAFPDGWSIQSPWSSQNRTGKTNIFKAKQD